MKNVFKNQKMFKIKTIIYCKQKKKNKSNKMLKFSQTCKTCNKMSKI